MSYQNFTKGMNLAKKCDGYLDGGGKSNDVIFKAEKLLDIKFSKQTFKYFNEFGFIEFFGHEIYGIIKDDFSGTPTGCSIETTIADREEYQLPKEWLTIYCFDDGYMGYLDYSQLNEDGEPPVIMAIYDGEKFVVTQKVAEDLGDFIIQLIEE